MHGLYQKMVTVTEKMVRASDFGRIGNSELFGSYTHKMLKEFSEVRWIVS